MQEDGAVPRAPLAPIARTERIEVIDQLRGFAVFGILVVNTFYFFHPFFAARLAEGAGGLDRAAEFFITFLFVSKFYTLFSFLFGLGMYVQMQRAETRGSSFTSLYVRRLFVLALLGLAHGVLLWIGDILLLYAVAGLLTFLLFRHRSPRTLKVWAIVLLSLLVVVVGLTVGFLEMARLAPDDSGAWESVEAEFAAAGAAMDEAVVRDYEVYGSGSLAQITRERWADFTGILAKIGPYMLPSVMAMFLLGLRAGRRGWFDPAALDSEANRSRCRRLLFVALPLGLLMNLYVAVSGFEQNRIGADVLDWKLFLQFGALTFGSVLLALVWVALALTAARTGRAQGTLRHLAPVGRMALTNYLTHSVVMTTLAYGYGFGLYGAVGPALGLLLAILLYSLQVPLSAIWLRRFRFGPVEWLWRSLTYGRWQRFRA